MHLPVIFHIAVKVQIPLAIKNICNLAELGTLGRIVYFFQLSVLLQAPKHLRQTGSNCIPVFILLEHALASRLCWCFGLDLSIDLSHKHTLYTVNGRNHFTLWSRTIYARRFFDSGKLPKKYEPASGVAAGASGACKFCTSKITIKSDLYPPRIVYIYIYILYISFSPYTLQPPRRQEFQPASQLSPIVTTTFTIVVLSHHV